MNVSLRAMCAFVLLASAGVGSAHASVQIMGTRVIYPADEHEVTVNVLNNGSSPRLLQAWADKGDPKTAPEKADAPFLITPPMSRVEPGKAQALRLMFTGGEVPSDRESVFWLNVLEVPPRPKEGDLENYLQFAVRTRIKIFYRPKGLMGDPMDAVAQLTWRLVRKGSDLSLECANPTAYNVSFADVQLKGVKVKQTVSGGGMCPAKGRELFAVTGEGATSGKLAYKAINDFGGFVEGEAAYTP